MMDHDTSMVFLEVEVHSSVTALLLISGISSGMSWPEGMSWKMLVLVGSVAQVSTAALALCKRMLDKANDFEAAHGST